MIFKKKIPLAALLKEKGPSVYSVSHEATVAEAVAEMNQHRVGSVLVLREGKVVGIFTERDVLTRVVASGRNPEATTVREVMTSDFQWIIQESYVDDAMQLMTDKRVRHLPVLENAVPIGMISIGDITRLLLELNEMEADTLRRYLAGEYPG